MKLSVSRRLVFYLISSCFFVVSIAAALSIYEAPSFLSSAPSLRYYFSEINLYFVEFFALLLIANVLIYKNLFFRAVLYFLFSAFIAVYSFQLISLYYTGEFISSLAIDNADHLYLFLDPFHLLFLALFLSFILLTVYLTEHGSVPQDRKHLVLTLALLTFSVFVYASSDTPLWGAETPQKSETVDFSQPPYRPNSPILSLAVTLHVRSQEDVRTESSPEMSIAELESLKKIGFHFNQRAPYPLVKDSIYTSGSPFPVKADKHTDSPNVIIIFTEGLSARSIGAYGAIYSDLTPYIDDFARQSMVVNRYYNHTAATYRGLHGQLASIYPLYGGVGGWHSKKKDVSGRTYLSLADLFLRRNYETIFLDSHHKAHRSRVDEMMAELGFETVVTGDELAEAYLDGALPLEQMAYSDQQYFKGVIAYLENRAHMVGSQKPFLMSLYNFGTHAFLNHSKDGYRYHSHNNVVLNNTHNFDAAFGLLWNYIKTSSYGENTVLVFTADHCHFHENAFLDAFSEPGYTKLFVDRIPLIIWDPSRSLPARYDARNASSIDFAPTMAHYFGLDNVRNPFLGMSLFEREQHLDKQISVAAIGPHEIYLIDEKKIHRLGEESAYNSTLKTLDKFVTAVRQLEIENRIWDNNFHSD